MNHMSYFQYKIYYGNEEKYLNLYGEKRKIERELNKIIHEPIEWEYLGSGYQTLYPLQRKHTVRHIHGFEERRFKINNRTLDLIEVESLNPVSI